VHTFV